MASKKKGRRKPPGKNPGGHSDAAKTKWAREVALELIAEALVAKAREGRSEPAKWLLTMCATHLKRGDLPPLPAAAWLAEHLEAIEEQEVPWGVPLLRRKRGQKAADSIDPDLDIAVGYWIMTRAEGYKGTAACLAVAEQHKVSEAHVARCWKKHRKSFEGEAFDDYLAWRAEPEVK